MLTHAPDQVDIDAAEERARRAQDGMSFNREALYREALQMSAELRRWRAAFERAKRDHAFSRSTVFDDIFGSGR